MTTPLPIVIECRILAGTEVTKAATALCALVQRLGGHCYVSSKFNGAHWTAGPDTSPQQLIDIWDRHTSRHK